VPTVLGCVRKSVKAWVFCASVKARALIETEKFANEYQNNRNWLMRENEPVFQKPKMSLLSSLTNFNCFKIHGLR